MRVHLVQFAAAWICLGMGVAWGQSNVTARDWVTLAQRGLYAPAQQTLARIPDDERRLLALRAYLRAGNTLPERWSWSAEQIAVYPNSAEGRRATAELQAVAGAFAHDNPGYELRINLQPRSLERQLQHWNTNASVATTAHALAASLAQQWAGRTPDAAALRQALIQWTPPQAAALAAPGLSPHGQARAFDFEVVQDGHVIAADDYASAHQRWDRAGWTMRLHAAVAQVGPDLSGPLAIPYEPWHYAYRR
jgi:hypothetical protein